MENSEKVQIRKIQNVLQKIDNGSSVFFNISVYKKLGLVIIRKKWGTNAVGNKIEV